MSNMVEASEDNFDAVVLESKVPVFIEYWAEWCGPCKALAPVLNELAEDYDGEVKFVKVNIDENSAIAQKYAIRGIPTMMIFKEGELKETLVGALAKNKLIEFIDDNID